MKYFAVIVLFLITYVSGQNPIFPVCDPNQVSWHHHPLYCDRYFLCFWGVLNQRFCAPGLHYNRITTQCMSPNLANCEIDTGIYCPEVDDPNVLVFLSDFNDCGSYFLCYNGNPISRSCAEGFWWDMYDQWCTTPDIVRCDPRAPNDPQASTTARNPDVFECPISSGTAFYPHTQSCRKYFVCTNGNTH